MVDEPCSVTIASFIATAEGKIVNIFAIALINVRGNYGGRELLMRQLEKRQERDKTFPAEIRWELANDCR